MIGPNIMVTRFPEDQNGTYDFDVSVSVKPEVLDGMNLKRLEAVVYVGDEEVGRNGVTGNSGSISVSADNVRLGTELRVEVIATQDLEEGAYLFLSDNSQALDGYVKGGQRPVRRMLMRTFNKDDLGSFEFPATGGSGTEVYIVLGSAVAVLGLACLLRERKRRKHM